jgi:F-box/WD-40 domain protein 7
MLKLLLYRSGMELKDNILVSGNADSTVKIWDILSGQCLQTLSGTGMQVVRITLITICGGRFLR